MSDNKHLIISATKDRITVEGDTTELLSLWADLTLEVSKKLITGDDMLRDLDAVSSMQVCSLQAMFDVVYMIAKGEL